MTEGIFRGGRMSLSKAGAHEEMGDSRTPVAPRGRSSTGCLHPGVTVPKPHTLKWVPS